MEKIKKYIYIIGIGLLVILIALLIIEYKANRKLEKDWKTAVENYKAYSSLFSGEEQKNRALELTVNQLSYCNDSIIQKLDEERKKLKIKDSQLKSLHYVETRFTKTDTLVLKDTLFRDPQINIDTLLSDEWYAVKVGLKYPSTVSVSPEFKSEKYIIASTKKETVNPPKKFFLLRWLQKKHTVLTVDVVEKNPYIKGETNRFVEIIK